MAVYFSNNNFVYTDVKEPCFYVISSWIEKINCFCWFHTKMKNLKRFSYVNSWIWYSVCAIYRITDRHFKRHWEQLAVDSLILESNGVKNKNQHCIIRCSGKESLLWLSNTVNGIWFELMWAWNKEFYDLLYY